jgi:hypothetical protein
MKCMGDQSVTGHQVLPKSHSILDSSLRESTSQCHLLHSDLADGQEIWRFCGKRVIDYGVSYFWILELQLCTISNSPSVRGIWLTHQSSPNLRLSGCSIPFNQTLELLHFLLTLPKPKHPSYKAGWQDCSHMPQQP